MTFVASHVVSYALAVLRKLAEMALESAEERIFSFQLVADAPIGCAARQLTHITRHPYIISVVELKHH